MELAPDSMIRDYKLSFKRYRTSQLQEKNKFEKLFTKII